MALNPRFKVRRLPADVIERAVAVMLGCSEWSAVLAPSTPAPVADHNLYPRERRQRRESQARVLETLGFDRIAAGAVVEALLPTGDRKGEAIGLMMFADQWVRELGRLPTALEMEVGWLSHNLGLSRADQKWAAEVAKERILIDGGATASASEFASLTAAATPATDDEGYFGVVAETKLFYQGYFLADPGAEAISAVEKLVRDAVAGTGLDPLRRLLSGIEDMIETGFAFPPTTYVGALEAGVIASAVGSSSDMTRLAAFAQLLSRELGVRHFVVRLVRETERGGMVTSAEPLQATGAASARAAIKSLPDVVRIEEALMEKMGFAR